MGLEKLKTMATDALPYLFIGSTTVYLLNQWVFNWFNQSSQYYLLCASISLMLLSGIHSLRQKTRALEVKSDAHATKHDRFIKRFMWFMFGLAVFIVLKILIGNANIGIAVRYLAALFPMSVFCFWLSTLVSFIKTWGKSQDLE